MQLSLRRTVMRSAKRLVEDIVMIDAVDHCPSSDDLRRFVLLRNGGSGSSGLRGQAGCA